ERVVVVDDGSTDGTADRARAAGAEVIVHETNRGKGTAVRTGLARVFEGDYTHVLLLDGDMQHLPGEAASLVAEAERSAAAVVVGERQFDRSRMPAARYHANRIGSRVVSWFVGGPVRAQQCGLRVFLLHPMGPLAP